MIRLLRYWLPVVPIAMAVLIVLYHVPDLGPCPARGGLLSLTIGCLELPSTVAIGPVNILGAGLTPEGDLLAGVFTIAAVALGVLGARRIRALAR